MATLEWEQSHDARAVRLLRSSPSYPRIVADLAAGSPRPRRAPQFAGGRWFRIAQDANAPGPMLFVSSTLGGHERPVFSPRAFDGGVMLHVVPSVDGRLVASVHASSASGRPWMRIATVEDGRWVGDSIDLGVAQQAVPGVAWDPSGRGLYYVAGGGRWGRPALCHHEVGGSGPDRLESVVVADVTARPQVSPDGQHVMLLTDTIAAPTASWIRGPDRAWRPFFDGEGARCHGLFLGDTYVAVSAQAAPRGRLVRIPLGSRPDSSDVSVLVAESRCVLWDVIDTGTGLLLSGLDDDRVRLWSLSYDGVELRELPMPGAGAVGVCAPARSPGSGVVSAGGSTVAFVHQTPTRSAATYRIDLGTDELEAIESAEIDLATLSTRRTRLRAADGTELPVQLTYRRDLELCAPHPVVLTAYGALGQADLPGFVGRFRPFIEAGGVHAWATVRGGAEFGDGWRDDGRRRRLAVRTSDFCAVAEQLIERGSTTSRQLVLWGASAGGQLVADALVRRPELFAGAVALIPLADLLRFDRDAFGREVLVRELGDPAEPASAAALRAASPYHGIEGGDDYPALLIVCADDDDMAPSWHGRKLAARLSEYSDEVYLRIWRGIGHAEAAAGTPATSAEWLTFLMARAGMTSESTNACEA